MSGLPVIHSSLFKGLGIFFDKAGGDFVPTIYQEFLHKFEAQPGVQVLLHLRATTIPYVRIFYAYYTRLHSYHLLG
jgi:hypothetical protein